MMPAFNLRTIYGMCIGAAVMVAAGCGPANPIPTPSAVPDNSSSSYTPIPTLSDISTVQVVRSGPTRQPTVMPLLATLGPSPTPEPSPTSAPPTAIPKVTGDVVVAPETTAEADEADTPSRQSHYTLQRPIAREEGQRDWLDPTYPYGGTQFGTREVHLGVEFFNPRFTPILAAGDGQVIYAGDDREQLWGPEPNYYGNLVVVQHDEPAPDNLTLYTIYGHMERIAVQTGDRVAAGSKLGVVGDTGIAIGPHLHFEVRVGDDPRDYLATRNPALWIQMFERSGTLVGYAADSAGQALYGTTLLVYDSGNAPRETYTYGSDRVNSDPSWRENFVLADLRAGRYSVVVRDSLNNTLYRENITIEVGQTTWLDVVVTNPPTPSP